MKDSPLSLACVFCHRFACCQVVLDKLRQHMSMPSASTICRARFLFDGACMLLRRTMLHSPHVHYFLVDASPQGGRDFELAMVCSIAKNDLVGAMQRAHELVQLWGNLDLEQDPAAVVQDDEEARHSLQAALQVRVLPPVQLGQARANTLDRYVALMHALWLDWGPCNLRTQSEGVVSLTSDLGVEAALTSIKPVQSSAVFPWLVDDEGLQESVGDAQFSLNHGIPVAGLLHIIHNTGNDLEKVMSSMSSIIEGLQALVQLLSNGDARDRLLHSCFGEPEGQAFHSALKAPSPETIPKRGRAHVSNKRAKVKFEIFQHLSVRLFRECWLVSNLAGELAQGPSRPLGDHCIRCSGGTAFADATSNVLVSGQIPGEWKCGTSERQRGQAPSNKCSHY